MKHYKLSDGSTISYPDHVINFELPDNATEITESEMFERQKMPEPPPKTWVQNRLDNYPPYEELADAVVEKENGNPTAMKRYLADVVAVKKMYPKD